MFSESTNKGNDQQIRTSDMRLRASGPVISVSYGWLSVHLVMEFRKLCLETASDFMTLFETFLAWIALVV